MCDQHLIIFICNSYIMGAGRDRGMYGIYFVAPKHEGVIEVARAQGLTAINTMHPKCT